MISDGTRRTIRTAVQWSVSAAAAAPLIVGASGLPEATPGLAVGLAVAAGLTRVMALPAVDGLLPRWLRAVPAAAGQDQDAELDTTDPDADPGPAFGGRP